MAKVVNRASDIIQLKDLKDGEFAEVMEWFEMEQYLTEI